MQKCNKMIEKVFLGMLCNKSRDGDLDFFKIVSRIKTSFIIQFNIVPSIFVFFQDLKINFKFLDYWKKNILPQLFGLLEVKFHHYLVRHNHTKPWLVGFSLVLVPAVVSERFLVDHVVDLYSATGVELVNL